MVWGLSIRIFAARSFRSVVRAGADPDAAGSGCPIRATSIVGKGSGLLPARFEAGRCHAHPLRACGREVDAAARYGSRNRLFGWIDDPNVGRKAGTPGRGGGNGKLRG